MGDIKTHNWKNHGKEAILKPAKDKKGYLRTVLSKKTIKVHRVIAQIFIPNPENKPQVNHKNGIKHDNRVINLEWVTGKENTEHAIANGLFFSQKDTFDKKRLSIKMKANPLKGSKVGTSKLTESQVLEIRAYVTKKRYGRKALAHKYGVKECTIKDIITRKSWKHI